MSKGINKVFLIGHVGKDPDMRYTQDGKGIANISIATTEYWNDKATNQRIEQTEWHKVVFFGKLADVVGSFVHKGSKIFVEGSLRTRKWEKDGVTHYTTEIIGNEMQMLDSRNREPVEAPEESNVDIKDINTDIPF